MAWLKHIDVSSGRVTRHALDPHAGFVVERTRRPANFSGLPQPKGSVRIFADVTDGGTSWHASPGAFLDASGRGVNPFAGRVSQPPPVQQLAHGSAIDAGTCGWLFLEHAEERNESLEEAACTSEAAAATWADWLEAKGGPLRRAAARNACRQDLRWPRAMVAGGH